MVHIKFIISPTFSICPIGQTARSANLVINSFLNSIQFGFFSFCLFLCLFYFLFSFLFFWPDRPIHPSEKYLSKKKKKRKRKRKRKKTTLHASCSKRNEVQSFSVCYILSWRTFLGQRLCGSEYQAIVD